MTSATGNQRVFPEPGAPRARRPRRAGFTMLEILLVLTLAGILAAAVVIGATQLIRQKSAASPEQCLMEALEKGRELAVLGHLPVTLAFQEEEQQFVLEGGTAATLIPVASGGAGPVEVTILVPQPGEESVLIGGSLVETRELPGIVFQPDGTCTDCRVQFRRGSEVAVIKIDPWTGAPVLSPDKEDRW